MIKINEKAAKAMELVTDLGLDLKERSKNSFDHNFINQSVDDINRAICLMIELSDD